MFAALCPSKVKGNVSLKYIFIIFTFLLIGDFSYAREMPPEAKDLDLGYHSAFWSDLNSDGVDDLFFLSGYETYFSTFIYLGNTKSKQLRKIYHNKYVYSMVMDPENDKHPEFIDSSDSRDSVHCRNGFLPDIPDGLLSVILKEYENLVGDYSKANFTFSMPEHFSQFRLQVFNKIKIYRIEGERLKNVTSEYTEHLKWRINFLKKALEYNEDKCTVHINNVIGYIQSILDDKSHNITSAGSSPLRGRTSKPLRGLAAAAASVIRDETNRVIYCCCTCILFCSS